MSQPATLAPPRLSFLTPVYETPPEVLEATILSVLAQTDGRWQLCLCDDGSARADTREMLDSFRGRDPRILVTRREQGGGIAAATNRAAQFAVAPFLAFLDHDDTLAPEAVAQVLGALDAAPEADLLYTDEDKIEADGRHAEPYRKPDWSPEHLRSVMYLLHLLVVRKALFLELGGLRAEYDGAQDYDLALRASARARRVLHVPQVLYHWRKVAGSAAAEVDAKPEALKRGRAALADSVAGLSPPASVASGAAAGLFRVRRDLSALRDDVTVVIPTGAREREGRPMVLDAVRSIRARTAFDGYRLLVAADDALAPTLRRALEGEGAAVVRYERPRRFNYAAKLNAALAHVDTEHVVTLNDDVRIDDADWLGALLEPLVDPAVGMVGARLMFEDGRLQHAGMALAQGPQGLTTRHLFYGHPSSERSYQSYAELIRNYALVTGAAAATRMSLFRRLGGYDERFAVDYNDADFCLRVWASGRRVVYTPFAKLTHFENSSFQRKESRPDDQALFRDKWSGLILDDPFTPPESPI